MAGSNNEVDVDCERLDIAVLLVDDDITTLSVNAGFLRSWQYKVATATSGHEALQTLKEFRGFFDLVITDINMKGMNGFELQKRVKCEFHLPVINRRKSVMSRSLEEGAAFCLVKPIRREDLRDLWQYAVVGKREKLRVVNDRIVSVSDEEEGEGEGDSPSPSPATIDIAATQDSTTTKSQKKQRKQYCKRKRSEVVDHDNNEELIFCGPKRSRIFWTTTLHNRFLLALRHLGMDKAVPTKILEIMNVPGLTRENIASHLQKYRLFLKKIAEKGILEGLPERALRSRFATGLPTDLIRDIQKTVSRFHHHHENHYHQPYTTTVVSRPHHHHIPQNPPITTRPLLLANNHQTGPVQPNQYGNNNHTYRNFPQSHYHNGGGFMTSANSLTANNGLMSNYDSLGNNNRNFGYGPTNSHGMMVPYASSGLQRSPRTYNNNRNGTTQLNNNNASLTAGTTLNRVQNVSYNNNNNRFGLLSSNGSAANNAIVPVSSSSVVNVRAEPNCRANVSAGLPSLPQQSINGTRNAGGGGGNHNQQEAAQMDDLDEFFHMVDDMVLLGETATNSPRAAAGARSSSDNILSSFNVEDYIIELLQGDDDHGSAQTSERSLNVLTNKSSTCTKENPNLVMRNNDAPTNLDPLNMFMEDKANSPSQNSTSDEEQAATSHLDWDMDLIETLFDAADSSQK